MTSPPRDSRHRSGSLAAAASKARRGDWSSAVVTRIRAEARQLAQALDRRRGSPDGLADGSDLVQSVLGAICASPADLGGVHTADDLRRVLSRKLLDRWIHRRRRERALKRGGGRVRAASQLGDADDADALDGHDRRLGGALPRPAEVAADLADMLGLFAAESVEQRIVQLLLEERTQEEIGELLGLSRHAVGRRIRQVIVPTLWPLLVDSEAPR